MKILIATGLYFPEIGGPATHTRLLEHELPKHGIEVDVIAFSSIRTLPPGIRHLAFIMRLYRKLQGVDLLFSQDTFSCGFPALIAARLRGVPFIVRVPGDYAWEQARERKGVIDSVEVFQYKRYEPVIELLRAMQAFVVRHADHVVVPSQFLERIVRTWKPRALSVIYNGVDIKQHTLSHTEERYPHPYILTASRLVHGKGFEALISLMKELPAWKLVLVGAGPLEQELRERVKQEDVQENVIFTGAISPEDMFALYADATVFVLNSEFESFSFQVLEALSAGVPTISTRVGAIPEILESGREGLLVEPNDKTAIRAAVESVLTEPLLWKNRVANGQKKAASFSAERCGTAFAQLFREIV